MPPSRLGPHDRRNFFKYTTAETARIVLSTGTLRWSSPARFNDPLDVLENIADGVSTQEVAVALGRRVAQVLESPSANLQSLGPKAQLLIGMARALPHGERAEFLHWLREEYLGPASSSSLDDVRAVWNSIAADLRILCLTEEPLSGAMWHHYAGAYTGVVLELESGDASDSPWLLAQPVSYGTPASKRFDADEMATFLLGSETSRVVLEAATLRKEASWSYEREWRVVGFRRQHETEDVSDYGFAPEDLAGIYLGPRISGGDRETLVRLAKDYPRARLFEVLIGPRSLEARELFETGGQP